MYKRLVFIDTVYHQSSPPAYIVDSFIGKLLHARGLDDNVESIRVVSFELLPLRLGILAVEFNILVTGLELFGNLGLNALVGRNDDPGGTIKLQELSQYKARRTSAEKENLNTDWRAKLIEAVYGTGSRFQESCLFIGEILYLVELLLFAEPRVYSMTTSRYEQTYYAMYSAKPPSIVTPRALKSSHKRDCPRRQ